MLFCILRRPMPFLALILFCSSQISGCAVNSQSSPTSLVSESHPQKQNLETSSQAKQKMLSLYDVIAGAVSNDERRLGKRDAIRAYENCRTSSVFVNYHVKQIYRDLFNGISRENVGLDQQHGYVYVSLPKEGFWPDVYALSQLAAVVAQNEHIYVFIPNLSPFSDTQHVDYLLRLKRTLSDRGVDKDHVKILPMEFFQEAPTSMVAHNDMLPLKLCYG